MKKILSIIAYKGSYGVLYSVSLMPMSVLYGFSSFLYVLTYYIFGYRKSVVMQNISRSFPEKRYDEVNDMVKKFYLCFAANFAEIIKSISTSPQKFDKKLTFVNLELIDNLIRSGKNVVVSMGHCGNWELLNFLSYKLSHDMYAVYKPLRSGTANLLMIKLRSRFGMKLISNKSIARHMLKKEASPSIYYFLADQCPRIIEDKYRFEFLHQTTFFFSGMEKLARISDSAVVYLHITQTSKGNYKIICKSLCTEPMTFKEGEITQKYIDLLTENINEEPHRWLWSHKRWKR
ncbi:MAG: lysophospholipid acyltransferase family protein [Tannerellaceae bacterium]|jgi:KDO2-lipid IV(A) lauroyltransferase|nr:lysophospholipid acyltransferase family protein [Tannerellaceae bacterium]